MFSVNGLYGHVRRNNTQSILLFLGFIAGFVAVVSFALWPILLLGPTFVDIFFVLINGKGLGLRAPAQHFVEWSMENFVLYGLLVAAVGAGVFALLLMRQMRKVLTETGFVLVNRKSNFRLFTIVENLAITAGIPTPRIGIIDTPARNAFAGGLGPRHGYIAVTRGLIEALDDDELAAVVAHEVVHIRNNDVRLVSLAQVMHRMVSTSVKISPWQTYKKWHFVVMFILPPLIIIAIMMRIISSLSSELSTYSRSTISASREFIADAQSVELTKNPGALISALQKVSGRSHINGLSPAVQAMMIDGIADGEHATHPPLEKRIAVLFQHAGTAIDLGRLRRDSRQPMQPVFGKRVTQGLQLPDGVVGLRAAYDAHLRGEKPQSRPYFDIQKTRAFAVRFAVGVGIVFGFYMFIQSVFSSVEKQMMGQTAAVSHEIAPRKPKEQTPKP